MPTCVLLVAIASACSPSVAGDGGTTGGGSTGGSSTTLPDPSTSSTGTSGVAETSTTEPGTTTTAVASSEGEETHTIYFDVGTAIDAPPDDSTTGGIIIDWDCDSLVQPFESQTELVAPRGYHDVVFDQEGHIYGWDGNSVVQVTYDNTSMVFLPGVNSMQGMEMLGEDLLWVNDFGELRRVTPDLVQTTVSGAVSGAYGLTIGPDQQAYVCTGSQIVKVDPETGESSSWLNTGAIHSRAMVFNLDSTGVYISTLGPATVWYQPVDEDLMPDGAMVQFASNVGMGYHDGLGIDACGNLYVPDFNTRGLYRIDPDGVVTMMFNQATDGPAHYGHGLEWGSGIDGWNDRAIYMPQPYDGNTVLEVVLGVPSGALVRTWEN